MRTVSIVIIYAALLMTSAAKGQDHGSGQAVTDIRIQKLVHDVLGKTITLNFKENARRSGTLLRANGSEFILEIDDVQEKYPTSTIRSITIKPGIPEGILVVLSSALMGGFGLGVATLTFDGISSGMQTAVAIVFGIFGGWLGYGTFFQEVVIELP